MEHPMTLVSSGTLEPFPTDTRRGPCSSSGAPTCQARSLSPQEVALKFQARLHHQPWGLHLAFPIGPGLLLAHLTVSKEPACECTQTKSSRKKTKFTLEHITKESLPLKRITLSYDLTETLSRHQVEITVTYSRRQTPF